MNCTPTICIALLLLSLSAGMWLLYKTQKESLNTFFKVVAWFVIVVSLCSMICCGMRCLMHGCMSRGGNCGGASQCEMGGGGCDMRGDGCMKEKRIVMFRGGEDGCEKGEKGCCKEGKSECEGEEEEESCGGKDSVVVKK